MQSEMLCRRLWWCHLSLSLFTRTQESCKARQAGRSGAVFEDKCFSFLFCASLFSFKDCFSITLFYFFLLFAILVQVVNLGPCASSPCENYGSTVAMVLCTPSAEDHCGSDMHSTVSYYHESRLSILKLK